MGDTSKLQIKTANRLQQECSRFISFTYLFISIKAKQSKTVNTNTSLLSYCDNNDSLCHQGQCRVKTTYTRREQITDSKYKICDS